MHDLWIWVVYTCVNIVIYCNNTTCLALSPYGSASERNNSVYTLFKILKQVQNDYEVENFTIIRAMKAKQFISGSKNNDPYFPLDSDP